VEDPDEQLFETLRDCGLALKVPITTLKLDDFEYPCIRPEHLFKAFADEGHLNRVLGVPISQAKDALNEFWRKWRIVNPTHEICQGEENWSRLLPFYLHGDGGRTYKKDPILILSMFNCLGRGTAKKTVSLQPSGGMKRKHHDSDSDIDEAFDPGVNLLGHSFTHRFLFTAMKAEFYKNNRGRFNSLIDQWGQQLAELYNPGVEIDGTKWRIVILGLTGDAPFLREAGFHNRSFSNVKKSHQSKAKCKGVCWLCGAGKSDDQPFEDVNVSEAKWLQTIGRNNPLPWDTPGPLLAHLMIDQEDPASFYKPDLFHILHSGVGKDFCASSLIYFCRITFKESRIALGLDTVNDLFRKFLIEGHERVNFSKFTFDMLGYESSKSFPTGHWSKGLDTAVVTKFIEHVVTNYGDLAHGIPKLILQASMAINHAMRLLFSSSYWMSEEDAWQTIYAGQEFLHCYVQLARICHAQNLCLFKLKPKLHMMCHIVLRMLQEFKKDPSCVVNPVAEATFMSEDFVGHVSRLSRRVNARRHGKKIFNRYFVAVANKLAKEEKDGKGVRLQV